MYIALLAFLQSSLILNLNCLLWDITYCPKIGVRLTHIKSTIFVNKAGLVFHFSTTIVFFFFFFFFFFFLMLSVSLDLLQYSWSLSRQFFKPELVSDTRTRSSTKSKLFRVNFYFFLVDKRFYQISHLKH